jgi:negative regulator of flagellin synthesis FlgM
MKIESSTKTSGSPLASETRTQSSVKTAAASNDDVTVSGVAAHLAATDDGQTFDLARVTEIKQAITEGRFKINTGAIADRLISSAKELVAAQRQA